MVDLKINNMIRDEESLLSSKTIGLGDSRIITPFKILDFNDTPTITKISDLNPDLVRKNNLVEKSRIVDKKRFLAEVDNPSANYLSDSYESFKRIERLNNKIIINTLTFKFNPYKLDDYEENINSFMHIYHGRTDILFVPNLKTQIYDPVSKKSHRNVAPDEYLKFVNSTYATLSYRNSKPIFIPLPLRYGVKTLRQFVKTYVDMGFRNFWLDYEGSSSLKYASHVRAYHEIVDKAGLDDKTILYATNIRRELNPHITESECSASDLLVSPLGVDFIGVNREPQHGGGDYTPPPIEESIKHKARFLNRINYNYVKYSDFNDRAAFFDRYNINETKIKANPKFYSGFANTFEMNDELDLHKRMMRMDNSVLDYLESKNSIPQKLMKAYIKIVKGQVSPSVTLDSFI